MKFFKNSSWVFLTTLLLLGLRAITFKILGMDTLYYGLQFDPHGDGADLVLISSIIDPVWQEVVFRGPIYIYITRVPNYRRSALIILIFLTSVGFSLIDFISWQDGTSYIILINFLNKFVIGIILAIVTVIRKSLTVPLTTHILYNSLYYFSYHA